MMEVTLLASHPLLVPIYVKFMTRELYRAKYHLDRKLAKGWPKAIPWSLPAWRLVDKSSRLAQLGFQMEHFTRVDGQATTNCLQRLQTMGLRVDLVSNLRLSITLSCLNLRLAVISILAGNRLMKREEDIRTARDERKLWMTQRRRFGWAKIPSSSLLLCDKLLKLLLQEWLEIMTKTKSSRVYCHLN